MEIVKIGKAEINGATIETVDARELHAFLGSKQRFADWIKGRIAQYGFSQDVDFTTIHKKMTSPPTIDYALSMDMAKELSMVERNDRGKQARQYFIECERQAKQQAPMTVDQLLEQSAKMVEDLRSQNVQLVQRIEQDKPMTEFGKAISESATAVKIGDWVKAMADDGFKIGRNQAFAWLRDNGYLMQDNQPYQQYVNQGLFEVKEGLVVTSKGQRATFTTLLTGKGQMYFGNKLKAMSGQEVA